MDLKEAKEAIEQHTQDLVDVCPHCEAKVHIEKLWSDNHRLRRGNFEFYVVFRCKPCTRLILKVYLFKQNQYSTGQNLSAEGWKDKFPLVFPDELSEQDVEHIPIHVLQDYKEALKCLSIGAQRASCAMFRRSLQSSLLELGADQKLNLVQQITSMPSLPEDIKDWAHQIRIWGNWSAHPDHDKLKEVSSEDVVEAQDFMSKFLSYTFVMPAKVKESRARREAKNSQESNDDR